MEPMKSSKPYRFEEAKEKLKAILDDFDILAGTKVGESGVVWQDVAGTLACNLHTLSLRIEAARQGHVASPPVVFPCRDDV